MPYSLEIVSQDGCPTTNLTSSHFQLEGMSAVNIEEHLEIGKLIQEAKEMDKEVIEQLPKAKRFQFARIRDDIQV